jgi:preprotein translocase subunit SecA
MSTKSCLILCDVFDILNIPSMPVILSDDKVWFDETFKLAQICKETASLQTSGHSVLLLSHFAGTLSRLGASLREKEIRHERFSSLNPSELCRTPHGKVWLGLAGEFRVANELSPLLGGAVLEILVAEHHPLQSRDQEVVGAAAKLSCNAQLCFYFSLDDPLMRHFGSDSVKALFERLGIEKSECISHHLINTAIRTAQEKIESKVGKDVPTHSIEDWFKYNLPVKQKG